MMWQDKANNLVWIKFKGGMPFIASGPNPADSNEDLYRTFSVVLYQK